MKKLRNLSFILFSFILLTAAPAQAKDANGAEHSMTFDASYTYLFTSPNAHMGTFGIGYGLKTASDITFNLSGYGGYGILLTKTPEITGFSVAGMQALAGYALDLTDSIYINLAMGFGFSFTSSKVATSIINYPASLVSLKMPIRLDFVFNVMEHFDIVSGIQYSPLWMNAVSFSYNKKHAWRVHNELALFLSFKYVF